LNAREAYYRLLNVPQYPEILPWAYDLVAHGTRTVIAEGVLSRELARFVGEPPATLPGFLEQVIGGRSQFTIAWRTAPGEPSRRQAFHFFTQYLPTALIQDSDADAYHAMSARIGAPLDGPANRAFVESLSFRGACFDLPVFLLGIDRFAGRFTGEQLGVRLVWQFLDVPAFGHELIHRTGAAFAVSEPRARVTVERREQSREHARAAATQFLRAGDASARDHAWSRVLGGAIAVAALWEDWFSTTQGSDPSSPASSR
jgi:hypothetical protein